MLQRDYLAAVTGPFWNVHGGPFLFLFHSSNAVGILVRGWARERLGYAHGPAAAVSPSTQISDSIILSTTAHKDLCFSLPHGKQRLQETDLIMGIV